MLNEMKEFLCSKKGNIVLAAVLFIAVFVILDIVFDLGVAIGVAIAGVVGFVGAEVVKKSLEAGRKK